MPISLQQALEERFHVVPLHKDDSEVKVMLERPPCGRGALSDQTASAAGLGDLPSKDDTRSSHSQFGWELRNVSSGYIYQVSAPS